MPWVSRPALADVPDTTTDEEDPMAPDEYEPTDADDRVITTDEEEDYPR